MRHGFVKVVLMMLTLAIAPSSLVWAAAPKLIVNPELYDFGMVETGNKINTLFTVINTGDANLVVSDIKADCGCTTFVTGARNIPPGGRMEIDATFDATGYVGKVSRTISLVTNDRQQPRKNLIIQGLLLEKIGGELVVTPHSLNTGRMTTGESIKYTYELRNSGEIDLAISQITTTKGVTVHISFPFVVNPHESKTLKFLLKPGEMIPMNVVITPQLTEGHFQEQITIVSTSVLRPVQNMVIRGMVVKK